MHTAQPTLWVTPQGRFCDVREEVTLRPGAAAIAARHPGVMVACVALEYVFWGDPKPELLIRFEPCPAPDHPTTAGWQRTMTAAMRCNQAALANLSVRRDPEPFHLLLGRAAGGGGVNPAYDTWLRARGARPGIQSARADGAGPRGKVRGVAL